MSNAKKASAMTNQHNSKSGDETMQQFAHRVKTMITSGVQALALSLASQHGIFEVMDTPKTSHQIAAALSLKERYVRELLNALVVSRIVEIGGDEKNTYHVPPNRFPLLVGQYNIAAMAGLVPLLCEAYDQVNACFKADGPNGVSYQQYPKFQEFMNYMSNVMHNNTLLTDFIPSIPGLEEQLESGITVLDVGCGRGRAPIILAQRFPQSSFFGIDISASAINKAQIEAEELGLENITFLVNDAAALSDDWTAKFDYVTALDCIHDQAKPKQVLREIHRVLKPDGVFSMLEIAGSSNPAKNIGNPRAIDGYVISLFHCMPVSLYFNGGAGLGTMWGREQALKMLEECGFNNSSVKKSKDLFNFHFISTKI